MASNWLSYNALAWTEELLSSPEDYEAEVAVYVDLIRQAADEPPRSLLHLGCGAGGMDQVFKRHFSVTGVDLSAGMLTLAKAAHPELEYIEADMRSLQLGRSFDAVVIPDSIDYMASRDELRQALHSAARHLKPGGVLLVVAKPREIFQNNNFAYTGERGDTHLTLQENNYINPYRPETYEATLTYLIRQRGELIIHHEQQLLGLFDLQTWQELFSESGFVMRSQTLDGIYDPYLVGEGGAYPMTIFVGNRAHTEP